VEIFGLGWTQGALERANKTKTESSSVLVVFVEANVKLDNFFLLWFVMRSRSSYLAAVCYLTAFLCIVLISCLEVEACYP